MRKLEEYNGEKLIDVKSEFFTQGGMLLYAIYLELENKGVQKLDTYQSQSEYMKDLMQLKAYVGQVIEFEIHVETVQSFDMAEMRLA